MEININNVSELLKEIDEAFFDIPFGNSEFQNLAFVANGQHTPERAYRAIGLRLTDRIKALKSAYFSLQEEDIDLEELNERLSTEENKFEYRRLQLKIEKKQMDRRDSMKLINDAIHEVNTLYKAYKSLPKITRQEFENGEKEHFKIRLTKQAMGINGALESLDNMGIFELPDTAQEINELREHKKPIDIDTIKTVSYNITNLLGADNAIN